MKPASIIFLIFAVMMFFAGIVCCGVAQAKAEDSGVSLFNDSKDKDGNRLTVVDFDEEEKLEKIQLSFKEATVNIIKGDKEKIELLNFIEGSYYNGVTNKTTLVIDNSTGFLQMLKEGFGGFSFNGFRHYVHNFKSLFSSKQIVNVYVNEATNLNSISISVEKGEININNVTVASDINLSIGSGSVNIKGISNDSSVSITGTDCNVSVKNSTIRSLNVNLKKGNTDISGLLLLSTLNVKTSEEGDVKLSLDPVTKFEDFTASVTASKSISLFNTIVSSPYSNKTGGSSAKTITVNTSGGTATIY